MGCVAPERAPERWESSGLPGAQGGSAALCLLLDAGDLYEELLRQDAQPLEHGVDSDDEDGGPGVDWQPTTRDADVRYEERGQGSWGTGSQNVSLQIREPTEGGGFLP